MLKVGYSQVNANPPLGIGIEGYFVPRVAKGFLDDIEVISMVLTCGDTTVAVVSVDVCFMNEDLIDRFCMAAEKATGIKKENIFLSATHTHTGPLLKKTNWFSCITVSIVGGLLHNIGQIVAACLWTQTAQVAFYLPVLLVSGTIAGTVIGLASGIIVKRSEKWRL